MWFTLIFWKAGCISNKLCFAYDTWQTLAFCVSKLNCVFNPCLGKCIFAFWKFLTCNICSRWLNWVCFGSKEKICKYIIVRKSWLVIFKSHENWKPYDSRKNDLWGFSIHRFDYYAPTNNEHNILCQLILFLDEFYFLSPWNEGLETSLYGNKKQFSLWLSVV